MPEFSITLYWVCWSKDSNHCVAEEGPFLDIDQAMFRRDELNAAYLKDAPPYRSYDHYHVYESETPVTRL